MSHNCLKPIAAPTTAGYWPFFMVEFKSLSRGGTSWVAENQNAGSEAHSVKAMETLQQYSRGSRRTVFHSVAFSCVADVNNASIRVHWCQEGAELEWISAEIENYHLKRDNDMTGFRDAARNIIDHGINERLSNIKVILSDIYVSDLDLMEKGSKARNADQRDQPHGRSVKEIQSLQADD
ncbi:hypothetical protein MMC19_006109 [Ptychographa xylographoides]|nr:hypothetical protein [Ptychographa xylographoides]